MLVNIRMIMILVEFNTTIVVYTTSCWCKMKLIFLFLLKANGLFTRWKLA